MSPEGGVDGDDGVAEGDEVAPEEGAPAGGVDELEDGADEGELLELGAFFDASSPHAARASAAAAAIKRVLVIPVSLKGLGRQF